MTKESTELLSYHIIDAIFNRLNLRLSEKGGLEKHSYLKCALVLSSLNQIKPNLWQVQRRFCNFCFHSFSIIFLNSLKWLLSHWVKIVHYKHPVSFTPFLQTIPARMKLILWYVLISFLFLFTKKKNQAEEEKRGARITQGKPFLKRGSSNRSSGSFRRRSIRLTKTEAAASNGGQQQPLGNPPTALAASTAPAASSGPPGASGGGKRVKPRDSDVECKNDFLAFT